MFTIARSALPAKLQLKNKIAATCVRHFASGYASGEFTAMPTRPAQSSSLPIKPAGNSYAKYNNNNESAAATTTSTGAIAASNDPIALHSSPEWSEEMLAKMSTTPFPKEVTAVLLAPVNAADVGAKPAGGNETVPYLPEIKYRGILNKAFGPGGWSLIPRGQPSRVNNTISREYALFALGRFVAQARGQQEVNKGKGVETALEGVKSNALMRCCKDLGVASELWDPVWVKAWKAKRGTSTTSTPAYRR